MIPFTLSANVSLLFKEVPLLERFQAAADSGFAAVEMWWPFQVATPSAAEVDELIGAIDEAGVRLTGLNLFAGDMPGGERGLVSRLDRRDEFTANLEVVLDIAERTGCAGFNALYGQRQPGANPADEDALALDNLALASARLDSIGGTVLIEPLSHGLNGDYPLETADQVATVVHAARSASGLSNVALLFDTFHLANNGEDLVAVVGAYSEIIGHVQLADTPGRGEPGTGTIDFSGVLAALDSTDYRGFVACEYAPTVPTAASLGWVANMPLVQFA